MLTRDEFSDSCEGYPTAFTSKLALLEQMLDCADPEPPYHATVYSGSVSCNIDLGEGDDRLEVKRLEQQLSMICCRDEIDAVFVSVPAMGIDGDDVPEQLMNLVQNDGLTREELHRALNELAEDVDVCPTVFCIMWTRGKTYTAIKFVDSVNPLVFSDWMYSDNVENKMIPVKDPFGLSTSIGDKL